MRARILAGLAALVACHGDADVKVTIDCDAYVAHMESVMADHIKRLEPDQRASAERHFAEANPNARAELLGKCKAIGTTEKAKLDCVMTAKTPDEISACPDF